MHTPGPWHATIKQEGREHPIYNEQALLVALVGSNNKTVSVANARLIAASPDLLAACREVAGHIDPTFPDPTMSRPEAMMLLRAAIAKAESK